MSSSDSSSSSGLHDLIAANESKSPVVDGPQGIAASMAGDLLSMVIAQDSSLGGCQRYRIGDYEFRKVDYNQILLWAGFFSFSSEQFLEVLTERDRSRGNISEEDLCFRVVDGYVVSIGWDFDRLPLKDWRWLSGIRIERMTVFEPPVEGVPELPESLVELFVRKRHRIYLDFDYDPDDWDYDFGMRALSLTSLPNLRRLDCHGCYLERLDLGSICGLVELDCSDNELAEIVFPVNESLREFRCANNRLEALSLAFCPNLEILDCGNYGVARWGNYPLVEIDDFLVCCNHFPNLDLSLVPSLRVLSCNYIGISELDLGGVPELRVLHCDWNDDLVELDLTPVAMLEELSCWYTGELTGGPKIKGASPNVEISKNGW